MNRHRLVFIAVLTASTVFTSTLGRAAEPPAAPIPPASTAAPAAEAERPRTVRILRVDGTWNNATIVSADESGLRVRYSHGEFPVALDDVKWIEFVGVPPAGLSPESIARLKQEFDELTARETPEVQERLRRAESALYAKTPRTDIVVMENDIHALMIENRSPAWIPLILRVLGEFPSRVGYIEDRLLRRLELLTGERLPEGDIRVLVRDWWVVRRDKLTVDLAKMSRDQHDFIVSRLVDEAKAPVTSWRNGKRTIGSLSGDMQYSAYPRPWIHAEFSDPMLPSLLAVCDLPGKRFDALTILANLRRAGRVKVLEATTRDAGLSPGKRIMAVAAISMADQITSHEVLIPFVRAEIEPELKVAAVLVLGNSRDPAAIETIIGLLGSAEGELFDAALWATYKQQAPAAVAPLAVRIRKDLGDAVGLSGLSIMTLGQIRTPESADILAEAMAAGLRDFPESEALRSLLGAYVSVVGRHFDVASEKPADVQAAVRRALAWHPMLPRP